MKYLFSFHDVRDGGFYISRPYNLECDADAMCAARNLLCKFKRSDSVVVHRYVDHGTSGEWLYIVSYAK